MTVWIFCRIRMMFDVPGGELILPVIKVGVLLGEDDSIFVISHGFVPPDKPLRRHAMPTVKPEWVLALEEKHGMPFEQIPGTVYTLHYDPPTVVQ